VLQEYPTHESMLMFLSHVCLSNSVLLTFQETHIYPYMYIYIAHETTICRDPHNSSNSDSRTVRRLGYKHTFYQNIEFTKVLLLFIYFFKNMKCLIVGY
jgi:hypothetical protein